MEMELHEGDVFACAEASCRIEVEVRRGGRCLGLTCCGRPMVRIALGTQAAKQPVPDKWSKCEQNGI